VKTGDLLLRFESTTLTAQADVAERALGVAEAELKANSQRSFADAESSSRIDLLAARAEQNAPSATTPANCSSAAKCAPSVTVSRCSPMPSAWTGRPVQTGER
jgi:multidrug resistance efflux pump